jgi:hypothetical protein
MTLREFARSERLAELWNFPIGNRFHLQSTVVLTQRKTGGSTMRYKPKSIAALQVALGGLPDAMHVEADRGIVVGKNGWRTSQSSGVA